MIRKYAVQIIGIALVVLSFFDLYSDVYLHITQTTDLTADIYLKIFTAFVLCLVGIYGGVQLFRLQEVGRKLGMILFFWILFVIVTRAFPPSWSDEPSFLESSNTEYLILTISICFLYVLAFVLLINQEVIDLMVNNDDLLRKVGTILSLCVPGLGRALTGNFLVGMVLFICYLYLMRVVFSRPDLATVIFLGFVIWRIFSFVDSTAVKKALEVKQTEIVGT